MKIALFVVLALFGLVGSVAQAQQSFGFVVRADFPSVENGGNDLYSAAKVVRLGGLEPLSDLSITDSCSVLFADGSYVARKATFVFPKSINDAFGVRSAKGVVYFPADLDPGRGRYSSTNQGDGDGIGCPVNPFGFWHGTVGGSVVDMRSVRFTKL